MGRQRFSNRNQNTTSFKKSDKRIGPMSNTIILIVLACLIGLMYLTQVTKTNVYGYKINDLSQKQQQLQDEHNDLEVASARLQSLDRIKSSKIAKSLVSVAPTRIERN